MSNSINLSKSHRQIKVYLIREEAADDLKTLGPRIKEFLEAHQVGAANFFISEQDGRLLLVVALDNDTTPWQEITGFASLLTPDGLPRFKRFSDGEFDIQ